MNTMELNVVTLPRMIDLSCVKTDNTMSELAEMVRLAKRYRFICCFAMPCFTPWLGEQIKGEKDILLGGTVGFPSGADSTDIKMLTAREMLKCGCRELDMVINVGALKSGLYDTVENELRRFKGEAGGAVTKVILEVACLNDDEIKKGSEIAVKCGIDFVKTGTGWMKDPTTVHHIQVIKSVTGKNARIKASGGIRTLSDVRALAGAGCSRLGIGLNSAKGILAELETAARP